METEERNRTITQPPEVSNDVIQEHYELWYQYSEDAPAHAGERGHWQGGKHSLAAAKELADAENERNAKVSEDDDHYERHWWRVIVVRVAKEKVYGPDF